MRVEIGDALDEHFLSQVMSAFRPDVIIQPAALLSPFCLTNHPLQAVVRDAGFAFQLSAQLPVAPFSGIGNACILQYLVRDASRRAGRHQTVKIYAHHVHAIGVLKNDAMPGVPDPMVFLDDWRVEWHTVRSRFDRYVEVIARHSKQYAGHEPLQTFY